jgi:hypothetical protein
LATETELQVLRQTDGLSGKYQQAIDRESAYERLTRRVQAQAGAPAGQDKPEQGGGLMGSVSDALFGSTGPRGGRRDGMVQMVAKSVMRQAAGRLVRGLLGSLLGGRR